MWKILISWTLVSLGFLVSFLALNSNSFLWNAGDSVLWAAISVVQLFLPLAVLFSLSSESRVKKYTYLLAAAGFALLSIGLISVIEQDASCTVFCGIQYAANVFFVFPLQLILGLVLLFLNARWFDRVLESILIVSSLLVVILVALVTYNDCASGYNPRPAWCYLI